MQYRTKNPPPLNKKSSLDLDTPKKGIPHIQKRQKTKNPQKIVLLKNFSSWDSTPWIIILTSMNKEALKNA